MLQSVHIAKTASRQKFPPCILAPDENRLKPRTSARVWSSPYAKYALVPTVQSYNRYSYVMNNPTNFTDPTGYSMIAKMEEDAAQRAADRFARSGEANQAAATEKYGAGVVGAILNIAKHGINAETGGALMNAMGQMKESAKNAGAAVAQAGKEAVVGAYESTKESVKTTGAAYAGVAAYTVGTVTNNESLKQAASDGLEEQGGTKIVTSAIDTASLGRLGTVRAVVSNVVGKTVRGEVEKKAEALSKPVNLPAFDKVTVDMPHIRTRHMEGGSLTNGRTVFVGMNERGVEAAIKQAYQTGQVISTQADRVLLSGTTKTGVTVEMWYNRASKLIETAYPVGK